MPPLKSKKLRFGLALLVLAAIPLTLSLSHQPQKTQSQAITAATQDVTAQIEKLGNPSKVQYPDSNAGCRYARNVWDMQNFNGKIYIGSGNSANSGPCSNAGPVPFRIYDPPNNSFTTETIASSPTGIPEEQIDVFRIINGQLATPGHDPKDGNNVSWYRLESGNWVRHSSPIDTVHANDIHYYQGKLLISTANPLALISTDDGTTWPEEGPGILGGRSLFEFKGKMYISSAITANSLNAPNLYEYLGNDSFKTIPVIPPNQRMYQVLFPEQPFILDVTVSARLLHPTEFNQKLVYIGSTFVNDMQTDPFGVFSLSDISASGVTGVQAITLVGNAKPWDIVVNNRKIYILGSIQNGSRQWVTVSSSSDLITWTEEFRFDSPTFARSFEQLDGDWYFGLGTGTTTLSTATGDILRYKGSVPSVVMESEIAAGATDAGNQYQSDLRVNPLNSNQISITAKNSFDETKTILFNTQDGGLSWASTPQPSSGDPDSVYDLSGNVHWSFIDHAAGNTLGYRKSTDGGKTWSTKRNLTIAVDHPHIAVDSTSGPYRGSLYIAGRNFAGTGISVAYSRDGGTTWVVTQRSFPNTGLNLGFVYGMDFLKDGTLLIPMVTKNTILSTNGVYAGSKADIYVLRSTDGGQTVNEFYVAPSNSPAKWGPGGFGGLGNLAVGAFGNGERVYVTDVEPQTTPAPAKLLLMTSDDGGKTWASPRQIVQDIPSGWGASSNSLMVNKDGVVGVQLFSTKDQSFDLYFAHSLDGGASFATPLRVSSVSSLEPPNQPRALGQDQVYADVAPDGSFHTVWTDARNGATKYTIYTRSIHLTSSPATPSPTTFLSPAPTTSPKPGDIGGNPDGTPDGRVNIQDYTLLFESYGKRSGDAGFNSHADFVGAVSGGPDGVVNILDYTVLFENFGS